MTGRRPKLVALAPNRPADYNGWFNHPVGLTFQALDQTSGVGSCSSMSYGGPDGLGLAIGGTCTDVAGNTGSGSFPLNYDATPPGRPSVEALPGKRRVRITWTPSPGALAEVVRIRKHGAPKVLYRGPKAHFTHRKLRNGRRYRYRVTLIDQAGNRSADRVSAVPTRSRLLQPANGAHVRSAPRLVWKRMKRATYYNAQLVRRPHEGPQQLAAQAAPAAPSAVALQRPASPVDAGPLLLVRLAGPWRALRAPLRPTARQELLHRRALNRPPVQRPPVATTLLAG